MEAVIIVREITGHAGGVYTVVFYHGKRFTVEPANTIVTGPRTYLAEGLMTICGWPVPIEWVERRINRIIAREERKWAREKAREAEIKARWGPDDD